MSKKIVTGCVKKYRIFKCEYLSCVYFSLSKSAFFHIPGFSLDSVQQVVINRLNSCYNYLCKLKQWFEFDWHITNGQQWFSY